MSSSRQAAIWGIGLIIFGFALNVLAPVLLPFVAGFAIAYFLDPIVVWLGQPHRGDAFGSGAVLCRYRARVRACDAVSTGTDY